MRKSVLLASAISLLAASSTSLRAEEPKAGAAPDPDCNRVMQASVASDKKPSPQQLASELKLPIEKVNACLLLMRHSGSGATTAPAN